MFFALQNNHLILFSLDTNNKFWKHKMIELPRTAFSID